MTSTPDFRMIPRDQIRPNPDQPRKVFAPNEMANLAESIRARGVLQPLLVRYKPSRFDGTPYIIIGGERRWRASEGIKDELPVIVKDVDDAESEQLALIDNLHRVDLTALEEAHAIRAMMEGQGLTIHEVTQAISKSRGEENQVSQGWVNNRLALLRTGDDVKAVAEVRPNAMSSLLLVDKIKETETRAELLEAVATGEVHSKIKARVDAHQHAQEEAARAKSHTSPDNQTKERQSSHARNESSGMSRGCRVTGHKRTEVNAEVERALTTLLAWVPLMTPQDFEIKVEPSLRKMMRGELRPK